MKILMVCLGNICRSPLAEGIIRQKLAHHKNSVTIDSAGTGGWHAGEAPDRRSIAIAERHHIDISEQRARKLVKSDLDSFDIIFAMDASNYRDIKAMANDSQQEKIHLFLEFAGMGQKDVPDPWYGDMTDFESVYHLLDKAGDEVVLRLEALLLKKS
ncbi:MAG: low molecular weight phosphotyrosine protein phosphatase [Bacteroidia bacterium]|jgi:protein-tyrosine phosphatase|nr:low molecular weight phosphotyrosine protein phosphatase [Bacteroidia bacterium]